MMESLYKVFWKEHYEGIREEGREEGREERRKLNVALKKMEQDYNIIREWAIKHGYKG